MKAEDMAKIKIAFGLGIGALGYMFQEKMHKLALSQGIVEMIEIENGKWVPFWQAKEILEQEKPLNTWESI